MKIGNTTFNLDAIKGMTKEEFSAHYKNNSQRWVENAWGALQNAIGPVAEKPKLNNKRKSFIEQLEEDMPKDE